MSKNDIDLVFLNRTTQVEHIWQTKKPRPTSQQKILGFRPLSSHGGRAKAKPLSNQHFCIKCLVKTPTLWILAVKDPTNMSSQPLKGMIWYQRFKVPISWGIAYQSTQKIIKLCVWWNLNHFLSWSLLKDRAFDSREKVIFVRFNSTKEEVIFVRFK